MARPIHRRTIESIPEYSCFHTEGIPSGDDVILYTDEFEVIRLIDKVHLSQEEAAKEMGVSRATIASIYQRARDKIALLIVDGRSLSIGGGAFVLKETNKGNKNNVIADKGEKTMRIAVTYENGEIFQHFGRTEEFKVYDVENNEIKASTIVSTNGQGHGALIGVLEELKIDTLICGGIGGGARQALDAAGIKLYGGVSGDADQAVEALLAGSLNFDPDVRCSHHGDHHHGGNCGEHSCGEHHCGE